MTRDQVEELLRFGCELYLDDEILTPHRRGTIFWKGMYRNPVLPELLVPALEEVARDQEQKKFILLHATGRFWPAPQRP